MAELLERKSDRDLLCNGLALVNGATDQETWGKSDHLKLGNLLLYFDGSGKLIRLRILESAWRDRRYSVRPPVENGNV